MCNHCSAHNIDIASPEAPTAARAMGRLADAAAAFVDAIDRNDSERGDDNMMPFGDDLFLDELDAWRELKAAVADARAYVVVANRASVREH